MPRQGARLGDLWLPSWADPRLGYLQQWGMLQPSWGSDWPPLPVGAAQPVPLAPCHCLHCLQASPLGPGGSPGAKPSAPQHSLQVAAGGEGPSSVSLFFLQVCPVPTGCWPGWADRRQAQCGIQELGPCLAPAYPWLSPGCSCWVWAGSGPPKTARGVLGPLPHGLGGASLQGAGWGRRSYYQRGLGAMGRRACPVLGAYPCTARDRPASPL